MLLNGLIKQDILKGLKEKYLHITTQNTTKAQIIENLINFIKTCDIATYNNIKTNDSLKGLNIGDIGENIVFRYFKIDKENEMHEIKTFIIDTPNILIDKKVKIVYIFMVFNDINGLYKVNASDIYNIRLSKKLVKNLIENQKMVKVASLKQLATDTTK